MDYRLAALPRSWVDADVFILEDHAGRQYQYDPNHDHLERLTDDDANLLMHWYELSQTFSWHSRESLQRIFASPARPTDPPPAAFDSDSIMSGAL